MVSRSASDSHELSPAMMPALGETASLTRTVTETDVDAFAELVGDHNPVHMDDTFAEKTRFGGRVVHGMWAVSLISAVLGTRLPGPGTVYLSQSIQFLAPVYPGDTVTAQVTVLQVREDKPIITLATLCQNQRGKVVLKGEAVVHLEQVEQPRVR